MTDTYAPPVDALLPALRDRWSPAVFADRPVDEADLATVLSAAGWAPSTGNSQPWAYLVLRRGTPGHDALVAGLSRGNSGWVPTAPVVVVAAALTTEWQDRSGKGDYALYDLGQSVAHLTIQAQSVGLHTHQFAGFDHDGVASALGVPSEFRVMVGIALGHVAVDDELAAATEDLRARHAKERTRLPLGDIARDGGWDEPYGA